jgi:hypothetical protein
MKIITCIRLIKIKDKRKKEKGKSREPASGKPTADKAGGWGQGVR